MSFRNLMEDVVSSMIEEVISNDKDISQSKANKDEIIAYVLNRTKPRYITSERGIMHGKLDSKYSIQQKTDILLLIYEAITVFKRRPSPDSTAANDHNSQKCLPHILGEVLEESTFSVIPDIEVTLLYNDTAAALIDPHWDNPYRTNRSTMGYFHFWPEFNGETMHGSQVNFEIQFNHPKLKTKTIDIDIDVLTWKDRAKSYILPITLLNVNDGIDLDFIYK